MGKGPAPLYCTYLIEKMAPKRFDRWEKRRRRGKILEARPRSDLKQSGKSRPEKPNLGKRCPEIRCGIAAKRNQQRDVEDALPLAAQEGVCCRAKNDGADGGDAGWGIWAAAARGTSLEGQPAPSGPRNEEQQGEVIPWASQTSLWKLLRIAAAPAANQNGTEGKEKEGGKGGAFQNTCRGAELGRNVP